MDNIKCLKTFEEVEFLVSKIQNRRIPISLGLAPSFQEYYRGQISKTFDLRPSLSRGISNLKELEEIEYGIIHDFKNLIASNKLESAFLTKPFTSGLYGEDWYLLAQAQHCGLPTRLLDWTLKMEVALYFAVEDNKKFNDHDGQFWVFSPPQAMILNDSRKNDFINIDPLKFKNQNLVNPAFFWTEKYENEVGEKRRAIQHGKFFVQPLENTIVPMENQTEISGLLEKYCIPKESKSEIREKLITQGFTHENLYPELDPIVQNVILEIRKKYFY